MNTKSKSHKNQIKTTPPKKEVVMTKDEFFRVLDRVIQPIPSKAKPPKTETKETSE